MEWSSIHTAAPYSCLYQPAFVSAFPLSKVSSSYPAALGQICFQEVSIICLPLVLRLTSFGYLFFVLFYISSELEAILIYMKFQARQKLKTEALFKNKQTVNSSGCCPSWLYTSKIST